MAPVISVEFAMLRRLACATSTNRAAALNVGTTAWDNQQRWALNWLKHNLGRYGGFLTWGYPNSWLLYFMEIPTMDENWGYPVGYPYFRNDHMGMGSKPWMVETIMGGSGGFNHCLILGDEDP